MARQFAVAPFQLPSLSDRFCPAAASPKLQTSWPPWLRHAMVFLGRSVAPRCAGSRLRCSAQPCPLRWIARWRR
eukprot:scaffold24_cov245-Pinguiococcus_pyrenoidosus.AAC.32